MATTDSIKLSGTAQQTSFALRLASAISSPSSADGARGNVAFSPLSLHVALGLIAAGACGATRDQLVATLGAGGAEGLHAFAEQVVQLVLADSSGAGGPRVSFASAVFSDASLPLKPSFEEVAVGKYRAETRSVDFKTKAVEVAGQVNSWVDQVTSGLIKEILPGGSIDADTRLVLGNALYFKGTWAQKFHASDTKDDNFHLLDKTSIKAPFMSSKKNQYISSFENLKVLKLPYQQGGDMRQFSMYILLPKAQDGLWSLAGKLTSEPEFLEKHIPVQVVPIGRLKIPKFKISFDFEASKLFKSLGLQLPFSTEADLSEMVESPLGQSLCVSSIFHKSFVEVNEEGTEAAAATVAVAMCKSLSTVPPTKVDFVADHPFLFVIREDVTSVVLFVGHVINPLLVV